jgi:predicted aminopeptidase
VNARRGIGPLQLKFACLLFVSACSLGDLAGGQLTLINGQVQLDRAIEREHNPERRALLREVPSIRSFAEQVVGLWAGKSYTGYYETERKGLTFVVTASERLRLAPYSWWFPIAGKVEYRSFWDEDDANAQAAELEAAGYDTWISASRAYSTLGIFRDPVITTMLRDGLPALVEVLVHELSHAKLYVPGHTDWNEALASFVGERGAERYFEVPRFAGSPYPAEVRTRSERRDRFDSLIAAVGAQLEELYASAQPAALKLRERERLFLQLSAALQELSPQDDPETWRMNNARIVHFRRYSASNALLAEMWRRSDQNFRRFWLLAEAHSKTLQ